jgi:prepilin-type N-terminal cleavage/methylation domain-containing protein
VSQTLSPTYKSREQGFTLIEILVTMSIFGILLTVLLTGLWVSFETAQRIQRATEASQEAMTVQGRFTADITSLYRGDGRDYFPFNMKKDVQTLLEFHAWDTSGEGLEHIQYLLVENKETGAYDLQRKSAPVILSLPVGKHKSTTLLEEVVNAELLWLDGSTWREVKEPRTAVPAAIQLKLTRNVRGAGRVVALVSAPAIQGEFAS